LWIACLVLASFSLLTPAALASEDNGELRVLAAASLTEAFQEISDEFESAHPGLEVKLNFGGSNALAGQILLGARADIFASANQAQMDRVEEEGLIVPGSRRDFAANRLVAIWHKGFTNGIAGLRDLAEARSALKIIVADEEVPVGRYTKLALRRAAANPGLPANLWECVNAQVVSREMNVKSVYMKVKLGEADLGFVYSSDVLPEDCVILGIYPLPKAVQPGITYPIAALNDGGNAEMAARFQEFVLSPVGRALLVKHGFQAPPPEPGEFHQSGSKS
jgi:molybdate transport system substrate-binding protein